VDAPFQPKSLVDASARLAKRRSLRWFGEGTIRLICFACAFISIGVSVALVFLLIRENVPFFRQVPLGEFLTGTKWSPLFSAPKFGVLPLVAGTLMITIGSGLIALPLGLLAAVYLSEFASPRARGILKPMLEVLAGIPTVVYGFFGVMFVTPFLRGMFKNVEVYNGAAGAIVVAIMILPLVCSLCEDALSAVPKAQREGAYGLGSTKYEVTSQVVVPGALSGIISAFILALSRAIGETMAVTLAAGANPRLTANPLESIQTMTAYIVQVTTGDVSQNGAGYRTIFAVGLLLFLMTLAMNLFAKKVVAKYRRV